MREEFEQRDLDLVEEAKLREHDRGFQLFMNGIREYPEPDIAPEQMALRGLWRERLGGCPHRRSNGEGPAICDAKMRVCVLETYPQPCELFGEILEEWRLEYEAIDKADAMRRLSESLQR